MAEQCETHSRQTCVIKWFTKTLISNTSKSKLLFIGVNKSFVLPSSSCRDDQNITFYSLGYGQEVNGYTKGFDWEKREHFELGVYQLKGPVQDTVVPNSIFKNVEKIAFLWNFGYSLIQFKKSHQLMIFYLNANITKCRARYSVSNWFIARMLFFLNCV